MNRYDNNGTRGGGHQVQEELFDDSDDEFLFEASQQVEAQLEQQQTIRHQQQQSNHGFNQGNQQQQNVDESNDVYMQRMQIQMNEGEFEESFLTDVEPSSGDHGTQNTLKKKISQLEARKVELENENNAAKGEVANLRRKLKQDAEHRQRELLTRQAREVEMKQKEAEEKAKLLKDAEKLQYELKFAKQEARAEKERSEAFKKQLLKLKSNTPGVSNSLNASSSVATLPVLPVGLNSSKRLNSSINFPTKDGFAAKEVSKSPVPAKRPKINDRVEKFIQTDISQAPESLDTEAIRYRAQLQKNKEEVFEVLAEQIAFKTKNQFHQIYPHLVQVSENAEMEIVKQLNIRGFPYDCGFPDSLELAELIMDEHARKKRQERKRQMQVDSEENGVSYIGFYDDETPFKLPSQVKDWQGIEGLDDKICSVLNNYHDVWTSLNLVLDELKNRILCIQSEPNSIYRLNNLLFFVKLLLWVYNLWKHFIPPLCESWTSHLDPKAVHKHSIRRWNTAILWLSRKYFAVEDVQKQIRRLTLKILRQMTETYQYNYIIHNMTSYEKFYSCICITVAAKRTSTFDDFHRCLLIAGHLERRAFYLNFMCMKQNDGKCLAQQFAHKTLELYASECNPLNKFRLYKAYIGLLNALRYHCVVHKNCLINERNQVSQEVDSDDSADLEDDIIECGVTAWKKRPSKAKPKAPPVIPRPILPRETLPPAELILEYENKFEQLLPPTREPTQPTPPIMTLPTLPNKLNNSNSSSKPTNQSSGSSGSSHSSNFSGFSSRSSTGSSSASSGSSGRSRIVIDTNPSFANIEYGYEEPGLEASPVILEEEEDDDEFYYVQQQDSEEIEENSPEQKMEYSDTEEKEDDDEDNQDVLDINASNSDEFRDRMSSLNISTDGADNQQNDNESDSCRQFLDCSLWEEPKTGEKKNLCQCRFHLMETFMIMTEDIIDFWRYLKTLYEYAAPKKSRRRIKRGFDKRIEELKKAEFLKATGLITNCDDSDGEEQPLSKTIFFKHMKRDIRRRSFAVRPDEVEKILESAIEIMYDSFCTTVKNVTASFGKEGTAAFRNASALFLFHMDQLNFSQDTRDCLNYLLKAASPTLIFEQNHADENDESKPSQNTSVDSIQLIPGTSDDASSDNIVDCSTILNNLPKFDKDNEEIKMAVPKFVVDRTTKLLNAIERAKTYGSQQSPDRLANEEHDMDEDSSDSDSEDDLDDAAIISKFIDQCQEYHKEIARTSDNQTKDNHDNSGDSDDSVSVISQNNFEDSLADDSDSTEDDDELEEVERKCTCGKEKESYQEDMNSNCDSDSDSESDSDKDDEEDEDENVFEQELEDGVNMHEENNDINMNEENNDINMNEENNDINNEVKSIRRVKYESVASNSFRYRGGEWRDVKDYEEFCETDADFDIPFLQHENTVLVKPLNADEEKTKMQYEFQKSEMKRQAAAIEEDSLFGPNGLPKGMKTVKEMIEELKTQVKQGKTVSKDFGQATPHPKLESTLKESLKTLKIPKYYKKNRLRKFWDDYVYDPVPMDA